MKNELIKRGFNSYIFNFKSLSNLIIETVKTYPKHTAVLEKSFKNFSLQELNKIEDLAVFITKMNNSNLFEIIQNYKWLCNELKLDQFFYKKTGKYRLKTDKEVFCAIYDNNSYMSKYISGLLLTHLFWENHCRAYLNFIEFIESIDKTSYLEIGPGHGLYLSNVLKYKNFKNIEAWDISNESLNLTKKVLEKQDSGKNFKLVKRNIGEELNFKLTHQFDVIVMVETLECMENPQKALQNIYKLLSPNGIFYLNFPINAPAPDNLYLLNSLEEVKKLLTSHGFKVDNSIELPSSGYTIKDAYRLGVTISCLLRASK